MAADERLETGGLDPSDADLVLQARGGDRRAFGTLVERHAGPLFQLAVMLVGNDADAQDLVQETFLGAYQHLPRFEARASVRTWLVRILTRQAARHHRRESYRRTLPLSGTAASPETERSLRRDATVPQSNARMDLADLLAKLSPEHREVLLLREIEGLSYDAMAETLSLPRGTIESRLSRARAALRDLVEGPTDNRADDDSGPA